MKRSDKLTMIVIPKRNEASNISWRVYEVKRNDKIIMRDVKKAKRSDGVMMIGHR